MSDAVRAGYKQTEVGVIPEDWEVKRLREISPSQSVGLVINPSTYTDPDGTVVMLVGSDILPNKINWLDSRKITTESNDKLHASKIYSDDLVVMRVGEPGITAVVPPVLNGSNCASVMIVRRSKKFVSNWLAYLMNSEFGLKTIETIQYGTAQKCFNISEAANFQYPTPPLPEQKAIASALADVDALLTSLEELLTKKRQLKQAAMQELLTGKTRLGGFEGEWEEKKLGDIGKFISGIGFPTKLQGLKEGEYPFLKVSDMNLPENGVFLLKANNYIDASTSKILGASKIPVHSIVMAKVGAAIFLERRRIMKYTGYIDNNLTAFSPNSEYLDYKFIYHCLSSIELGEMVSTTALPSLSNKTLGSIYISMPSLPEQKAIAAILSELDAELEALAGRVAKTRDLKQGMMQELLTGRTRLV